MAERSQIKRGKVKVYWMMRGARQVGWEILSSLLCNTWIKGQLME